MSGWATFACTVTSRLELPKSGIRKLSWTGPEPRAIVVGTTSIPSTFTEYSAPSVRLVSQKLT